MATGLSARAVIVCAVLGTATIAHAQPSPTSGGTGGRRPVAVIDLSGDPTAEALANDLYNVLVSHADLQSVNSVFIRSLKGPFPDEERPYFEIARRAKQEAEDFLVQLDYGNAERSALEGTQALHNVRPSPDALGLYAELAFATGQAALKLRKPNDASLAFGLSYRLDPAKRPDPARYEPEIVEAYTLATTKTPVQAKLDVKGTGIVWIDGVDRGPPGTFDVPHGMHLVQLSGPDRETRGTQVNVPHTSAVAIEPAPVTPERKVERARAELAATKDAAARAGGVKTLAKLLAVGDAVLIEKGEDGTLRVQTWRDRETGFSAVVEQKNGAPGDLLIPLAPLRKVEPIPEVIPDVPVIPETPWYRTRWAKSSYVVIGLGIVVGAYLAATQQRDIEWGSGDVKVEGE